MHIHWQNSNLEGCQSGWPYDAALVMVLLNRRRDHTRDTDTVTAHRQRLVTAFLALNRRFHRVRIFGAELENVAHFDTAFNLQRAFTVRAGVAFHHVANISNLRQRQIALPVNTDKMFTVAVGTGSKITHLLNAAIDYNRQLQANRTQRARTGTDSGANLFLGGKSQRCCDQIEFFRFDFVQLVIATDQQRDQRMAALFCSFDQQRFYRLGNGQSKLLNQRGNGFSVRRVDLCHILRGLRTLTGWSNRFGQLNIGGIVRIG